MLVLVRHAMPEFTEAVPSALWPLSESGRLAARALSLPADALLVASTEVKAWQTLEAFGPVLRDARFNEVRRGGEPWQDDFRALRRAYVDGREHEGWESHDDVVARFRAGISDYTETAGARPLVVATHGMAMTLYLSAKGAVDDPVAFWDSLGFPDVRSV